MREPHLPSEARRKKIFEYIVFVYSHNSVPKKREEKREVTLFVLINPNRFNTLTNRITHVTLRATTTITTSQTMTDTISHEMLTKDTTREGSGIGQHSATQTTLHPLGGRGGLHLFKALNLNDHIVYIQPIDTKKNYKNLALALSVSSV